MKKIYHQLEVGAVSPSRARARDRARKVRGDIYLFWRESFLMAIEFRRFERVRDLPGVGVIAMEFVKK